MRKKSGNFTVNFPSQNSTASQSQLKKPDQLTRAVSGMFISDDDSGTHTDDFTWTPCGLSTRQVYQYFQHFPEDQVPYVDSPGDRSRCSKLLKQLPPQDNEARYCSHLSDDEQRELELFAKQRKENALGKGSVREIRQTPGQPKVCCEGCKKPIDSLAVYASRAGFQVCWHPHCFTCNVCDETLVDLIYFYDQGKLYCGRHHAEKLKPRCSNCDEIIFCEECTEAEGMFWHTHHFVCSSCSCALGGQRYIMRDQRPFCTRCFEEDYALKCSACEDIIALNQEQVEYHGQVWHAAPQCFACHQCKTSLLTKAFLPKHGYVFCSLECGNKYENTQQKSQYQKVECYRQPLTKTDSLIESLSDLPPPPQIQQKINPFRQQLNRSGSCEPIYESINYPPITKLSQSPFANKTNTPEFIRKNVQKNQNHQPPLPPKRTNSQLSDHSSIQFNQSVSNSNILQNKAVGITPGYGIPEHFFPKLSQTPPQNNSNSTSNSISANKSVVFNTVPVSETSSVTDQPTSNKPKGILKNTSSHPTSFLTNSLRKDDFKSERRRFRSIDQDLNKSWNYDRSSKKKFNCGYYSDVDVHSDTDSSSTIEDQENEDFNGDWEREAIAELNKQRHKSTSAVPSTFLNTQTNFASSSAPSLKAQRNLAKFNKTSKKLKKKSKKDKPKGQKPGNCLVQ